MPTIKQSISTIQQALAAKGFSPGNIDGQWGRRTEGAVRAFQAANGLVVDGIVGPKTAEKLGITSLPGKLDDVGLVWFQEARRLLGLTEGRGSTNNPTLLNWAKDEGIAYTSDDIPWCGLFVAHCIGATLSTEPLPSNPLGARSWIKFGGPTQAQPGAVMVFWRESKASGKGHVGFYAGEDDEAYHTLGGNQSDSVSIARVAKDRFLGARWPATVVMGTQGSVTVKSGDGLSTNEA